ncbi:MAG: radical SAM protein [bacterium]|nr:radical SAM protein [bacterium]
MKILFVVAPYGEFPKDGEKVKQKKGFLPPVGQALLGTILENDGHDVRILDMQIDLLTEKELIVYVRGFAPSLVCISMLDATVPIVNHIISLIKQNFPETIAICGGIHPSMYPQETLDGNKDIDYLVYGEAEISILELARAVDKKEDISKILGIYCRDSQGRIFFTGYRPIVKDLDKFPIPSRKFFDLKRYVPVPNQYKRLPVTNMISGRGCTYSLCTFCFESTPYVREKGYRRISVQQAIDEIKYLQKEFGIREISFWDDEFLMGGDWVEDFCDAIIKEKIDIVWSCYGKVNYVRPDRMKKMAQAGCWNIFFGLESGNQELLNFMKKGQTLDMMKNAVKWAHDAGIEVRGSFILGLPGETPEMGQKTIDFALSLDLDYGQFNFATPFKGTEMYDVCRNGDYGTYFAEGDFAKHTIAGLVFLPKGYDTPEQLLRLRRNGYKKFYLRPKYIWLKLRSINSYDDILRYWRGIIFLAEVRLLSKSGGY